MADIGGNITGLIQEKITNGKNAIGEATHEWSNGTEWPGWLGLQTGEKKRTTYNANIEESSHVFLCDFNAEIYALADKETRMIIKGIVYDVKLIDNPDEMDEQLEIYLRKVGAWNG